MAFRFQMTDKDRGYKRALATLKGAQGRHVMKAGLIGPAAGAEHPKAPGQTVAQIGARHEYGLGVPQRSFIRAYFDSQESELAAGMRSSAEKVLRGMRTPGAALREAGRAAVQGMREFILAGRVQPPLSEETIARKGHDTPLVDTHALEEALDYEVK